MNPKVVMHSSALFGKSQGVPSNILSSVILHGPVLYCFIAYAVKNLKGIPKVSQNVVPHHNDFMTLSGTCV